MAKDKLPKLYKQDDKLGVIPYQPGTKAEYHALTSFQGWSEKKPSARQEASQTSAQSGKKSS